MKKSEKIRLMKKYRIKSIGYGKYAIAFLEGLSAAENYTSRKSVKIDDIEPPT